MHKPYTRDAEEALRQRVAETLNILRSPPSKDDLEMRMRPMTIDGVPALALDTQEFCRSSNLSKVKLASALAELELAEFIVNATPGNPPLKSAWKLSMLSYDGEPPTRDYLRPLWRLTMLPFGDDEPTHDYSSRQYYAASGGQRTTSSATVGQNESRGSRFRRRCDRDLFRPVPLTIRSARRQARP